MTEVIAELQVERDAPSSVHPAVGRAALLRPETWQLYGADWSATLRSGERTEPEN